MSFFVFLQKNKNVIFKNNQQNNNSDSPFKNGNVLEMVSSAVFLTVPQLEMVVLTFGGGVYA
ncbi:hypothetical protein A9G40_09960 [Gilliamella sp. Nev3-1]|nr:hypothetical protein A9G40_09960 [Gilliamella apicola]